MTSNNIDLCQRHEATSRHEGPSNVIPHVQELSTKEPELLSDLKHDQEQNSPGPRASIEVVEELKSFAKTHRWDANLPAEQLKEIDHTLKEVDPEQDVTIMLGQFEDSSPYPEVRAAIANTDEDLPVNTIRVWVLAFILTTVGSGMNELLNDLRSPSVALTTYVIQLLAYLLALVWDAVMPRRSFKIGKREFTFYPGPFNKKEHALITITTNAGFAIANAYAVVPVTVMRYYYGVNYGAGFDILFMLTTQLLGFGFAGIMRRFLVWPAAMIWPSTLANCVIFDALHNHKKAPDPAQTNGWSVSRFRYLWYVFTGAFCWYWFPGWIMQCLSFFNFVTWIAPNNVVINQIFGGNSGIGMIPITFDWTIVSGYIGSPLIYPFHAIGNTLIGLGIMVVSVIGITYSGAWHSAYLPMFASSSFDNTGNSYNISRILTSNNEFDLQEYLSYSPIFVSPSQAISWGLSFAAVGAAVIHVLLYNGAEIWERFRQSQKQDEDVHAKLMQKYREVPEWWYLSGLLICVALSFVTICAWDTGLPWWALIVAIVMLGILIIPIGMVYAVSNVGIALNVVAELIVGYMVPGRPIAMMIFKTYGYETMAQGVSFAQDLKIGHYMKVPPRASFIGQFLGCVWAALVQYGVLRWGLANIKDICTTTQTAHFTCPGARSFHTNSILWGVIGPARIFSSGYNAIPWFFLIGACVPVLTWLWVRRWPNSIVKYVMAPVIFAGISAIPPSTPYIYFCWGLVGFIFNKIIKTRYSGWWRAYNYITSAALDLGLLICTIVIFFALQLPGVSQPSWWGNNVGTTTLDYNYEAVQKVVSDGETFA